MNENASHLGCGFIVLVVGLALFLLFDWGFLWGEVTAYSASCDEPQSALADCPLSALNSTTYRVDRQRNEVIYWSELWPESFRKLKDCIIVNRRNWSCSYSDDSARLHLRDGLLFEKTPESFASLGVRHVAIRRWQWYLLGLPGPMSLGRFLPEQLDPALLG